MLYTQCQGHALPENKTLTKCEARMMRFSEFCSEHFQICHLVFEEILHNTTIHPFECFNYFENIFVKKCCCFFNISK